MPFVFQQMILSRHLGLHIWVLVVSDGRKGNIAKDLNVVYQGSGRTFHLRNAFSSWSVFLWAQVIPGVCFSEQKENKESCIHLSPLIFSVISGAF